MANRARDEVIYIRGDEALKKRFDRIKEASGYKGNADSLNCLLDVYDGKRVDGDVKGYPSSLALVQCMKMKKQGVNINQIAYTINIYPGVFSDIQFQATNVFLKKIEDLLLKITEKLL
ncbi:MAG: hypothetical protein ACLVGL_11660 [Waltera sp.]